MCDVTYTAKYNNKTSNVLRHLTKKLASLLTLIFIFYTIDIDVFHSFLHRGSFYNIDFKLGKKTQKSLKLNELKFTVFSTEDTTGFLHKQKIDLGKETKKSIKESELESITFEHRGPCCPLKQIINNKYKFCFYSFKLNILPLWF